MIIRSQDKRTIEKFERAGINSGCSTVYVNGLPFGTYSTEEKAIKVLDMIEECYVNCNCQYVRNKVFQMPLDEDVEV